MKILFLDIDGVLNGHTYSEKAQSNGLDPDCVMQLNRVLEVTDCKIVISSAWRYMVLMGEMTLRGFEYMLRTHGIYCVNRLVGTTQFDVLTGAPGERVAQIKKYVEDHNPASYAVVDDLDLSALGVPFVQTDSSVGITETEANALIERLR